MYKKFLILLCTCVCLFGAEFDNALINKSLDLNLAPLSVGGDLEALVGLNGSNKRQIELGKKLFFEPRISKSKKVSCNSCHNLALGGIDLQASFESGALNTPTIYNVALNNVFGWDGRSEDLRDFIAAHMENIMDGSADEIKDIREYEIEFKKAYGESANIDNDGISDAINVFVRTLSTPTRFDDFLRGNVRALNKNEQRGLNLFIEKDCISCHFGVNLGGVRKNISEMRDYRFADSINMRFKESVKIPSLRNILETAPYMHNGIYVHIADAIRDMARSSYANREVFSSEEMENIILFLRSLNGTKPNINYPILPIQIKE